MTMRRAMIAVAVMATTMETSAPAHARTCRTYGNGENTVMRCENGAFEVIGPHGSDMNAGFERYPGEPEQPMYERWK